MVLRYQVCMTAATTKLREWYFDWTRRHRRRQVCGGVVQQVSVNSSAKLYRFRGESDLSVSALFCSPPSPFRVSHIRACMRYEDVVLFGCAEVPTRVMCDAAKNGPRSSFTVL